MWYERWEADGIKGARVLRETAVKEGVVWRRDAFFGLEFQSGR